MNRCIQRMAFCLAVAAAGAAFAAGDSGGTGGRDVAYDAGVKAIEHQDWAGAIRQFKTSIAGNRFNADAHNWLGYAYRNTGDLTHAFAEYEEALRLDPGHRGAHEYVGEAYVMAKDMPKAREHLVALEKLCGRNCPEYKELEEAISKAGTGG
jgi:Flp pilus assembly protein TadD